MLTITAIPWPSRPLALRAFSDASSSSCGGPGRAVAGEPGSGAGLVAACARGGGGRAGRRDRQGRWGAGLGAAGVPRCGNQAGGTGLGLLVVELRARRAQDDKTAAMVRENVASGSEQLPQLGSVGIGDVHVHRALEHVDYVRRDVEPEVERQLRTKRRVLSVSRPKLIPVFWVVSSPGPPAGDCGGPRGCQSALSATPADAV